jgi:hypothetical protein
MIITYLRTFRIGQFSIFDFAISYIAVYFLAPYLSKLFALIGVHVNREQWLWLTLPVSVLIHILIGKYTPFTKMVLDPTGGWIAKLVVIIMLLMVYIRR